VETKRGNAKEEGGGTMDKNRESIRTEKITEIYTLQHCKSLELDGNREERKRKREEV
jgi:hypothetical protein